MDLPQKTKYKTFSLILAILILSIVTTLYLLNTEFEQNRKNEYQRIVTSSQKLFEINLKKAELGLSKELETLLGLEGLSQAIADSDYQKLDLLIAPHYLKMQSLYPEVKILTFRTKEDTTLYRAHKRTFYGDKLSKSRHLIHDTNLLQASLKGFEAGKLELTYRVTKPIFHNDIYVGNVEIGIDPLSFIANLREVFNLEVALAVRKEDVAIMMDRRFIEIDEKYLLIDGTQRVQNYFTNAVDDENLMVSKAIRLENHLYDVIGYIIIGYDASAMNQEHKSFVEHLLLKLSIVALLLLLVLHFGFNRILSILSENLQKDPLTGLYNLSSLKRDISGGDQNLIILNNLKDFRIFNELYGIENANAILRRVASIINQFALQNGFKAYRISADEFALLQVIDAFEDEQGYLFITKLHEYIKAQNLFIDAIEDRVSIEVYSSFAYDHENVLEQAQMAIKRAKRDSLSMLGYSQEVDTTEESQSMMAMKKLVKYALEHHNIVAYFQPITDLHGKTIKYEALVRIVEFEGAQKIVLAPFVFLDIAIKSGLYPSMAKEVISYAINKFIDRPEKVSINILPYDLFDNSIMGHLIGLVQQHPNPSNIVVEITEHESIVDFEKFAKVIERLKEYGVSIAIDDFGSGYANYTHILKLKPDYLKIDGSLIQNILNDRESQILVKSIVRFAQDLGIKTIAEYVEDEAIFEVLKNYGVDEYQGYYFGKPMEL